VKKRKTKEGDNAQSPMRGVLINHHLKNLQAVNTSIPDKEQCQITTLYKQLSMAKVLQVEEQAIAMGDKVTSPLREVPNTASIKVKPTADKNTRLQAFIEEVEDKDSPGCNIIGAKRGHSGGGTVEPPTREVTNHEPCIKTWPTNMIDEVPTQPTSMPVCIVSEDAPEMSMDQAMEIPLDELASNTANIFTHTSDPFKAACIEEILQQVTISNDLMSREKAQVKALISEFTDVFTLSVSEVTPVEGTVHWLNIEPDTKFLTKIHQEPLTPPQQ